MAAASAYRSAAGRSIDDFPIVSRLDGWTRRSPAQGDCRCPAHEDSKASLSVGLGDDGDLVLKCHAGCGVGDVLRAVGGLWSDLFYRSAVLGRSSQSGSHHKSNGRASTKGRRGRSPSRPNPWTDSKIVDSYPYHDAQGNEIFRVVRFDPKDFRQCRRDPATNKIVYSSVPKEQRTLFNLPAILAAPLDKTIFIVEGEKDAKRLAACGYVVTTIPGGVASASSQDKWLPQYTEALRGRIVILIPDNDPPDRKTGRRPGREHVEYVARELSQTGGAALVAILDLLPLPTIDPAKKWDISDWLDAGGSRDQFEQAVAAARRSPFDPEASSPPAVEPQEADDDPHRLARLYLNQSAHPTHPDGRTFHYWRQSFYRWNGQKYREIPRDNVKAELSTCIKDEFDRLNVEAHRNPGPDGPPEAQKITTRIIGDTLQALMGLSLLPGHIEQPAWLNEDSSDVDESRNARDFISMGNGILDLQSLLSPEAEQQADPAVLLPHSPRFFSPISIRYQFDPAASCPTWLKFVTHNLESDVARIDMLQEWFGYCLTFDTSQQKFLMMEGEGSNGKSVICAALTALLGPENVSHVPLEVFGKDFSLNQTLGRLANVVSEVGEIDKMAEGFLKSFTSGDRMTFNRKHQSLIEAMPTARLVLSTNNRPRFSDRSGGIWRRMLMLPLRVTIAEDDPERVHGMDDPEWWRDHGELPGMFCWAIAGLHRLQQRKRFTQPELSAASLAEYRSESNPARLFLQGHYEANPSGSIVTKAVYKAYVKWCEDNGYRPLSSNIFGREIRRVFSTAEETQISTEVAATGSKATKRERGYFGVSRRQEVIDNELAENLEKNHF